MITTSEPPSTHWYQAFTFAPFKEGGLRFNKFCDGTDANQIDLPRRPMSERMVYLITSIAFFLPILNMIIWLAMHIIGKTDSLHVKSAPPAFEPWPEAQAAAIRPPELEMPRIVAPPADTLPKRIERYCVSNQENSNSAYCSEISVEYYDDVTIVNSQSETNSNKCVYDSEWALQSMHYINHPRNVDVEMRREGNTIIVEDNKGGDLNRTHPLPDPSIPWIQQPSFGCRPLVMSHRSEQIFYGIDPRDMSLGKAKLEVTKRGEVLPDHPEWGPMTKVETSGCGFPASLLGTVCEAWYSVNRARTSAQEYRNEWSIPLFYSCKTELASRITTEVPERPAAPEAETTTAASG